MFNYLLSLSYSVLPSCIPSSMRISDSRVKCLGHILRHPTSPKFHICFNPSMSLRTVSAPFRRGAPGAHWPELALAESAHRVHDLHHSPSILADFLHSIYKRFTIVELKKVLLHRYETVVQYHSLHPSSLHHAEDPDNWKLLSRKVK